MEATHPALGLFTVPRQKNTWDSCLSVVVLQVICHCQQYRQRLLTVLAVNYQYRCKSIKYEQALGRTKRSNEESSLFGHLHLLNESVLAILLM